MKALLFFRLVYSVLGISMVLWTLALPSTARAEALTFTSQVTFPLHIEMVIPDANGEPGEVLELDGDLHELTHLTLDGNGGFHLVVHANPQDIHGAGLSTGSQYRGTGASRFEVNGRVGVEITSTNNFQLIGQGRTMDLRAHEDVHLTVHADGTISSFHDHFRIEF